MLRLCTVYSRLFSLESGQHKLPRLDHTSCSRRVNAINILDLKIPVMLEEVLHINIITNHAQSSCQEPSHLCG